jgi:hypothetical protein
MVLASSLLCGSANLCHALIAFTLTTYQFESNSGQPTIFDGSTVTLGVLAFGLPPGTLPDRVFSFDIKDPNAVGGEIMSGLDWASMNITSVSAAGWTGSFMVDYTKVLGGSGTITVVGNGSTGSITDNDPATANGTWTTVSLPDQASTMALLGIATVVLAGIRSLQAGLFRRLA